MEMFRTARTFGLVCCVLTMACSLQASVMDSAVAWYKLDAATSGNVVKTQVVDSVSPAYATYGVGSTTPVKWTTAPTGGEGAAPSDGKAIRMASSQYGIWLFSQATGDCNNFTNKLYTSGSTENSMTMFTRVYVDSATYSWDTPINLATHQEANVSGFLFNLLGSNNNLLRLNVKMQAATGNQSIYSNSISVTAGTWSDVAFSYNAGTNQMILSVYDETAGFRSVTIDVAGTFTGILKPNSKNFFIGSGVGGASPMPGNIESFAFWNTALSADDLKSISVPEPATLALLGLGVLFIRKKK